VRQRFGREGLKRAGTLELKPGQSPFGALAEVSRKLLAAYKP
jgi:LAO/AO transport system kinase